MRVLVTGASGFIGGVVCRRALEQGHEVLALVRRPGSEPPGTAPIAGKLDAGGGLPDALALAQPDCVVHLAAEIASQRNAARVTEVNVGGTRRLLDACLALAEPPRLVFSSTVVTGDPRGALLTEESSLPVETPYGRSKQECERIVLESGLAAV